MQFLELDDVIEIHAGQIANYGGSDGLRDLGLLESALAQPEAGFGGQYLHADVFEMAAAYLFHLVMNHPFIDGNKRVGLEAALVFLEINSVAIEASDDELVDLEAGVWGQTLFSVFSSNASIALTSFPIRADFASSRSALRIRLLTLSG